MVLLKAGEKKRPNKKSDEDVDKGQASSKIFSDSSTPDDELKFMADEPLASYYEFLASFHEPPDPVKFISSFFVDDEQSLVPEVSVEFISSLFVDDEQSLVLDEQPTLQSCTWCGKSFLKSDLDTHFIDVHVLMANDPNMTVAESSTGQPTQD